MAGYYYYTHVAPSQTLPSGEGSASEDATKTELIKRAGFFCYPLKKSAPSTVEADFVHGTFILGAPCTVGTDFVLGKRSGAGSIVIQGIIS